jgi:hypothetical protein
MIQKLKIKAIAITRIEGKKHLCDIERIAKSFSDAKEILRESSFYCGKDGGYDKHQVIFTWEDGTIFKTRFDVKYPDIDEGRSIDITDYLRSYTSNNKSDDFAIRLINELMIEDSREDIC